MYKEFNYRLTFKIIGSLIILEGFFMLLTLLVALLYGDTQWIHFLSSGLITTVFGLLGLFVGRNAKPHVGKREGSIIVTGTWLAFSLFGMLPFVLSGSIPDISDAYFETMSGFTTTGASILNDIESLSHSILFWRSLTQWIGGLGIIVISLALLPIFGFSSVQLFSAEATGPTKEKIHPKMSETAKRLLLIYVILTTVQTFLLWWAGMSFFDAINHAFTTMATGGFSTKQASVGYWDSGIIQYIFIFFMLAAGINFSLFYFVVKAKIKKLTNNEELRFYIFIILFFGSVFFVNQVFSQNNLSASTVEQSFRDSFFTTISIITTTGYGTADFNLWAPFTWIMILILMLIGGSAGSTAGGIKSIRVLLMIKYSYYEFKRIIHPNAVVPLRYNKIMVKESTITRVLAFCLLYMLLVAIGAVVLAFSGMGFVESLSGMITCLSDVGPGLGEIGPANNFANIPLFSKWFLSIVMLIGRLELFTVLLLFTPVFWKK